jgi:hypothetical protein
VKDNELWVAFQYEKIPGFCFNWGIVVHNKQSCGGFGGQKMQRAKKTDDYGPCLQVASPRRTPGHSSNWLKSHDKKRMYPSHSSGDSMDSCSWRGTELYKINGKGQIEGGEWGRASVRTQGVDCHSMPDNIPPNPEGSNSKKRDLREPHINAGDSNSQHSILEEEKNIVVMKKNLQDTDLRFVANKKFLREGKEAIVGESFQKEFTGFKLSANKNLNAEFQQGHGCPEPNKGAKKGGKYPKKSGEVYVGQWSQIKEKME